MGNRLQSAIATIFIHGVLIYLLYLGLAISLSRRAPDNLTLVTIAPSPPPRQLPPALPRAPDSVRYIPHPDQIGWPTASPELRNLAFISIFKWISENTVSEEEKRLARWRKTLPQGSGPGRVTRVRPPNLSTHTVYWPARWSRGLLPIIAWGNGYQGQCNNSSLPYAGFLSEVASWGYFIVAVGNDDIDFPQPEGLAVLADGRPVNTKASALARAVEWAVAENARPGSPYQGRLDASRIAYMGHGCGAQQAITAAAGDPRATTAVALNASARFHPGPPDAARKPPLAHFEGRLDDSRVRDIGDVNFARAEAAGWPMYKATLDGMSHAGAYPGPDRRWSKAIVAWLDLELKGRSEAAAVLNGLARGGWSRIDATGLAMLSATPDARDNRAKALQAEANTPVLAVPAGAGAARAAAVLAFHQVPSRQVQVVPEDKVYVLRDLIADNPLYTFDKDEPGKSNCTGACAASWTPLTAGTDPEPIGRWTVIRREGGGTQWAYDGKPVYCFSRDPEPVATAKGVGHFHRLPTLPIE